MKNFKQTIFLILFVLSFIFCVFCNYEKINIPYFGGIYKIVKVDAIYKNEAPRVFFDDDEIKTGTKIQENHFVYSTNKIKRIKKISFENSENIEKLIIYNGNEAIFENNVKKGIEINNDKSFLDKFTIILLSFFYNFKLFGLSYLFLFLYLYNFKSKVPYRIVFIALLTLGLIVRCAQINSIPFWDDEIYVLNACAPYSKLTALFNDPGNPPVHFILFKIYSFFVKNLDFARYSSVITGFLFNIAFYYLAAFFYGKKKALFALLITVFNVVLIYFSQEIRCYMLLMLFSVLNTFFLFKFSNKNKIKYLISCLLILYTHFYAAFFVLWNFLFGLFLFKKNPLKLKPFLVVNLLAFIGYIPLIICKKASITSNFNSWMEIPQAVDYIMAISVFCEKCFAFVLFLAAFIYVFSKTRKKFLKTVYIYNFFAILFVFFLAVVFSYLIKPIFCYRYFYVVFPCYLTLVVGVISFEYNFKIRPLVSILLFIFLNVYCRVNYQNLFCNHNLYLDFVKHDIDKNKKNYIFMSDTVEGWRNFAIKNAEIIYLPFNHGIKELDVEKYEVKKPCVFYVLNLYLNDKTLKTSEIELYKSPLGVFLRGEYK